jgi:hypothetical protein
VEGGGGGLASSAWHIDQMGQPPRLDVWACAQSNVQWWMSIRSAGGTCLCLICACIQGVREGGLASSAWHIHKMGPPPRLGCLGMCTEQCAVTGISSKSWRNMFKLEMRLHTRQDKQGMRGKRWCRRCRRCAGERRRRRMAPEGAGECR